MYQMCKAVEFIELDSERYLADFESGALIKMSDKREKILGENIQGKYYEKGDFSEDPLLFAELEDGGYFQEVIQPLSTAYVHVTNICNLNCIGCYSYDRTRNCTDKLTLENYSYILSELAKNGVETVTISGGEPLIRKDIIEICRYAKDKAKISVLNLITNGTLYDEEQIKQLKKYVDALAVSIDGYSTENSQFLRDAGSFQKAVEFVRRVKELGLPVSILPTLHKKNIKAIGEYMKLSRELQVPISFSLLTCSGELKDFIPTDQDLSFLAEYLCEYMKNGVVPLQDYSELEARKSCGAGSSIISVTSEGDIYPCHMMHDTNTVMGNILERPLEEILYNAKPLPNVEDIEKCQNCEMKYLCGGGCKARALLINGSWEKPDPYCSLNMDFYKRFLKEKRNSEERK